MTKISYEVSKDENGKQKVAMNVEGKGDELLKGASRLMNQLRKEMDIEREEFIEILDGGMTVAELEDMMEDKSVSEEDVLKAMLEYLKK